MKHCAPCSEPSRGILLVDDNCHGLVARKTLLQEKGYRISTATSAAEALELFSGGSFDLVVTDYRMPSMDGLELIRRLRNMAPQVRIILLSGFVETMALDESATGADVVIAKNCGEVGNLLRSVDRLIGRGAVARKPPASVTNLPRARATGSVV